MSKIIGTDKFIEAHKDHRVSVSVISSVESRYEAEIQEVGGALSVVAIEQMSMDFISDSGSYLYCSDCNVEEEINLGEVIIE